MKRFLKSYCVCLFLLGLFLVLCMGGFLSVMLLPFFFLGHPYLSWMLAAFLLAIPLSAWATQKERRNTRKRQIRNFENPENQKESMK